MALHNPRDVSEVSLLREQASQFISEGKYGQAAELFSRLAKLEGNQFEGLYGRGVALYLGKSYSEAQTQLQQALGIDPSDANALYYLGLCAKQQGNLDLSTKYLRMCLAANPQHAGAVKMLHELSPIQIAQPNERLDQQNQGGAAGAVAVQRPIDKSSGQVGGFYALLLKDTSEIAQQARSRIDSLTMDIRPRVSAFGGHILYESGKPILLALLICAFINITASFSRPTEDLMRQMSANGTASQRQAIQNQIDTLTKQKNDLVRSPGSGPQTQNEIDSLNGRIKALQAQRNQVSSIPPTASFSLNSSAIVLLSILGILIGVLVGVWHVLKAKFTRYSIAEGRVHITSGVLSRATMNVELYKVEDVSTSQDLINLLTGDFALCLRAEVHGRPFTHKLRGIATASEAPELLHKFRDLVFLLRSGPWGKGVIS